MEDKCVRLIQITRYRWELRSPKDHLMLDLDFPDAYRAEQWILNYITSFQGWSFKLIKKEYNNGKSIN